MMILPAQTANPLSGTSWIVTEIRGVAVLPGSDVSFAFDKDGNLSGNSGVNLVGGSVVVDGDKISFDRLRSTRRAASQELMDQEVRFNRALAGTASFRIDEDGKLTLLDEGGTPTLAARASAN